jgi:hypothetical protein
MTAATAALVDSSAPGVRPQMAVGVERGTRAGVTHVRPAVQILGVPFFADANITVSGAGTASVYLTKLDDSFLATRGPMSYASPDPLAIQLSWLLRVHSYQAPTHRYVESSAVRITSRPGRQAHF